MHLIDKILFFRLSLSKYILIFEALNDFISLGSCLELGYSRSPKILKLLNYRKRSFKLIAPFSFSFVPIFKNTIAVI